MSSSGYIASGLTATGTTQATALQLASNAYLNQVATITATNNGVLLPTNPVSGQICKVRNNNVSGINVSVYPQVGGLINSIGLNLPYVIPSSCVAEFISVSTLNWSTTSSSSDQGVAIPAGITAHATGGQLNAVVIDTEQLYTLVSVCATTNDSVALPRLPIINKPYIVINNGVATCDVYPGNTAGDNSIINNYAANVPFMIGAKASCQFIAVSNTAGVIQWFATGYTGPRPVIPLVANITLVMDPSYFNSILTCGIIAGASPVTLPPLQAGFTFDYQSTGTLGNAVVFTPSAGGNHVGAVIQTSAGAAASSNISNAALQATVTATATSIEGDRLNFYCDGVNWYAQGMSHAAAGFSHP